VLFSPGWRAPVRQGEVLAVFTFGLLLGGTLSATAIWLLSGLFTPLPPAVRTWTILAVAALGVAREFGLIDLPLPQNARQIPPEVLQTNLRRGTLQFGFELGTAVRTYVPATAPYVLALALLLAHESLLVTLLTGAAFALGRALSATLTYLARDDHRDAAMATRIPMAKTTTAVISLAALALLLI
jgi:predicted lysophospholipase L1 biosynthesis ABC-type transport system permease subunit